MKNKKIGNEIKWYKPFKLIERINELEKLTQEQFLIINTYKDELDAAKAMIKSLKQDKEDLLKEIELKPEKAKKTTTKAKTTKKDTAKKETAKKTTTKKTATKKTTTKKKAEK